MMTSDPGNQMTSPGALLLLALAGIFGCQRQTATPPSRQPIIDVHLHAFSADWVSYFKDTSWFPPIPRATNDDSLREQSLRLLEQSNVVRAVASGVDQQVVSRWHSAAPDRIIPALVLMLGTPLDSLRAWVKAGTIRVLGEAIWQFEGVAPDDRRLEPLWALAEELDVPVAVHLGGGPPRIQREGPFRLRFGDPLPLEEVLARHPRLRVWVMHAGYPMGDRMVALLHAFPEVHVDVAGISVSVPRPEFHAYLRRLVDAGFGRNIMYGSDQAVWPAVIPYSMEAIESAGFLTPEQKRDIFCGNAARFLRLEADLCEG
jgi:predicted TIM-barrel fold metal-dependent hydrolase